MDSEWHQCHFCGTYVAEGFNHIGDRHWLSDCRPDLVEHEVGVTCTWHGVTRDHDCYAYQNDRQQWTDEHTHFYEDGPM